MLRNICDIHQTCARETTPVYFIAVAELTPKKRYAEYFLFCALNFDISYVQMNNLNVYENSITVFDELKRTLHALDKIQY